MHFDGNPEVSFSATRDGSTQLRRRWPSDRPRAAMVMIHGIGEHSGRYGHIGAAFAAAGIDVVMADNRGHGQTGTDRGYVESFDEFLDDIEDLLADRREFGVPVVLLGHSLGGLIAARYLVSPRPQPDLAILSAPALDADVPRWQRVAAPVLSRIAPKVFVPSEIDASALTRDPEIQEAYVNDPLRVGGATARLGHEIFGAMDYTRRSLNQLRTPTYVLHGAADTIVPPSASEPLATLDGVTRRVWPGLLHECFNEPEWRDVVAEALAWAEPNLVVVGGELPADDGA